MGNNKEYTWINVYVDHQDMNNVWAIVYYHEQRRTKTVSKNEIVKFGNYNSMIKFVIDHFGSYELQNYVPFAQKKIHINIVDYIKARYIKHSLNPSSNKIEVLARFYYNNGTYSDKTIDLNPKYQNMVLDLIRKSNNIPENKKIGPELFEEIDADKQYKVKPTVERVSRTEMRKAREKYAVPMPQKKKPVSIKKLIIYTVALAALFASASKGISLQIEHSDISDGISLDHLSGIDDYKLLLSKGHIGSIVEKLVGEDYKDLTKDNLLEAEEYINRLIEGNYAQNKSFHTFLLSEYKYENGINGKKSKLLDKLDYLYQNCFKKDHTTNNYVFDQEEGKKFLDFAIPLIIMSSDYYNVGEDKFVVWKLDTYSSQYSTEEEIKLYHELPPIMHEIVNLKVLGMLNNIGDYYFGYAHYVTGGRDADTLSEKIAKISENDMEKLKRQIMASKEEPRINGRK